MQALAAEAVAPATALPDAPASVIPAPDPDAELVAQWQAGDIRAFECLVRRHERRVFRLLYRMLGSREEAEDATQGRSSASTASTARREARFSTFLYRVAANAAESPRSLARALGSEPGDATWFMTRDRRRFGILKPPR
jgi:hypothetical protein